MRLHFPILPFSPFMPNLGRLEKVGPEESHYSSSLFSFLSSQPNSRNRIPSLHFFSLPSSSCHSKHSVSKTVKHYLPKVYKSIFYYYYYYYFFNFKNELYSKYDRNDTNLKFMKLKSNKDFVIIILK